MRTIIDLKPEQIEGLDRLRKKEQVSRAALVRRAVGEFLKKRVPKGKHQPGFGVWAHRKMDALAYQRSIRKEWNR